MEEHAEELGLTVDVQIRAAGLGVDGLSKRRDISGVDRDVIVPIAWELQGQSQSREQVDASRVHEE